MNYNVEGEGDVTYMENGKLVYEEIYLECQWKEMRKHQGNQQHEGRTEERIYLRSLKNKWGLEAFRSQNHENQLYYRDFLEKKKNAKG